MEFNGTPEIDSATEATPGETSAPATQITVEAEAEVEEMLGGMAGLFDGPADDESIPLYVYGDAPSDGYNRYWQLRSGPPGHYGRYEESSRPSRYFSEPAPYGPAAHRPRYSYHDSPPPPPPAANPRTAGPPPNFERRVHFDYGDGQGPRHDRDYDPRHNHHPYHAWDRNYRPEYTRTRPYYHDPGQSTDHGPNPEYPLSPGGTNFVYDPNREPRPIYRPQETRSVSSDHPSQPTFAAPPAVAPIAANHFTHHPSQPHHPVPFAISHVPVPNAAAPTGAAPPIPPKVPVQPIHLPRAQPQPVPHPIPVDIPPGAYPIGQYPGPWGLHWPPGYHNLFPFPGPQSGTGQNTQTNGNAADGESGQQNNDSAQKQGNEKADSGNVQYDNTADWNGTPNNNNDNSWETGGGSGGDNNNPDTNWADGGDNNNWANDTSNNANDNKGDGDDWSKDGDAWNNDQENQNGGWNQAGNNDNWGATGGSNSGGNQSNGNNNSSSWENNNSNNQNAGNGSNQQNSWNHTPNNTQNNAQNNAPNNNQNFQTSTNQPSSRSLYGPYGPYYSSKAVFGGPPPDAAEEPRYDVPEALAQAKGVSKQVQPGPGYLYVKKRCAPTYIDSIAEPYAKFVFKYRTTEQLKNEIGVDISGEPTGDQEVNALETLPKAELIQMVLRAKGALGGTIPEPPPKVAPPLLNEFEPMPLPAPDVSYLHYQLPVMRNQPNNNGLGIRLPSGSSQKSGSGQQSDQDWVSGGNNNNSNDNNKWNTVNPNPGWDGQQEQQKPQHVWLEGPSMNEVYDNQFRGSGKIPAPPRPATPTPATKSGAPPIEWGPEQVYTGGQNTAESTMVVPPRPPSPVFDNNESFGKWGDEGGGGEGAEPAHRW